MFLIRIGSVLALCTFVHGLANFTNNDMNTVKVGAGFKLFVSSISLTFSSQYIQAMLLSHYMKKPLMLEKI